MSSVSTSSLLSPSDLETIHACYSAHGKEIGAPQEHILASSWSRWRRPMMSPRIVLTQEPEVIARAARSTFEMSPPSFPHDSLVPYFNLVLPEGAELDSSWENAMAELGFRLEHKSTLVLFESSQPFHLPRNIHFACGSPLYGRLRKSFLDVMHESFPIDDRKKENLFWSELLESMRPESNNSRLVILETSSGKPVGACIVTSWAHGAYLSCLGIKKRFRGRGLARSLISICQLIASSDGCKHWLYSTKNPRIAKFGDLRFVNFTFVAESNRA